MEADAHQRYEDELAAYMLGSLEPNEAAAFEAHLADCGRCQARERWLRTSLDVLPSSVEQVEPPPALRERLMETVRGESGIAEEAPRRESATRRRRVRLPAWLGSLSLRPAAALAVVVLLLAAGVAGYAIRGGGGASGPSTERIAIRGTPAAPKASGTLVRDGDRAVLQVSNLPQKRGRVYEVWIVKRGQPLPIPATLFQVGANGGGSAGVPYGLDTAKQVLISSEPAGGSTQPTTEPVLSATIS
jgi:anti-sigma-K factor RskA